MIAAVAAPKAAPAHSHAAPRAPAQAEAFSQAVAQASEGLHTAPKRVANQASGARATLAADRDIGAAPSPDAVKKHPAGKADDHAAGAADDHAAAQAAVLRHKPVAAPALAGTLALDAPQPVGLADHQAPMGTGTGLTTRPGAGAAGPDRIAAARGDDGVKADPGEMIAADSAKETPADAAAVTAVSTAPVTAPSAGSVMAASAAGKTPAAQKSAVAAAADVSPAPVNPAPAQQAAAVVIANPAPPMMAAAGGLNADPKQPASRSVDAASRAAPSHPDTAAAPASTPAFAAANGAADVAMLPAVAQKSPPRALPGLLPATAVSSLPANAIVGGAPPPSPGPAAQNPAAGNAAALAAAVTAMVRDGQNSVTVRLDPPELGAMSIRIAQGHDSSMNVLLLAAVPQTAHAFAAGADDLRQALASCGLALGQLNIGGGDAGSQQAPRDRGFASPPGQLATRDPNKQPVGVRAIA
jgi:flagellar hook-length control protein FliK